MQIAAFARGLARVGKGMFSQPCKTNSLQESAWNDLIGIDVIAAKRDGRSDEISPQTFQRGLIGHGIRLQPCAAKRVRGSVTTPAMAEAATITGDISNVRPVGDPCRPLKLRTGRDRKSTR